MLKALKGLAEFLLTSPGLGSAVQWYARDRLLILGYHNIAPDDAPAVGDTSLHLPRRQFADQLDQLARWCDVIPLDAALAPCPNSQRPRVVITFDDAYRGAVIAGVEELVARQLPATIFVVPGFVGGRTFWWDALTPSGTPAPLISRTMALQTLQGRNDVIRAWAEERRLSPTVLPPFAETSSEEELAAAARQQGITLGSHTWSHPNLAVLPDHDLRTELARPLPWLRERFPSTIAWLSYPYGSADSRVGAVAAACGYRGALRIDGGRMRLSDDPFHLPRRNIPRGLSSRGFSFRVGVVH